MESSFFGDNRAFFEGGQVLKLPDGSEVKLQDFVHGSMFSSVILDESLEPGLPIQPFSFGRSQAMPIAWKQTATRAHTNIPRSGDNGLPKDWEGLVLDWSARVGSMSEETKQAFREWSETVCAQFEYNWKVYWSIPLFQLIDWSEKDRVTVELGDQEEADARMRRLVSPTGETSSMLCHMRENLSYRVVLTQESTAATERLADQLRGPALTDVTKEALTRLDTIAGSMVPSAAIELRKVAALVRGKPAQTITLWVSLWGYWRRVVV